MEKEAQFVFRQKIRGDCMIQLKEGKVLFYDFMFFITSNQSQS